MKKNSFIISPSFSVMLEMEHKFNILQLDQVVSDPSAQMKNVSNSTHAPLLIHPFYATLEKPFI